MTSEKITRMIDAYFDGELKKEEEVFLFSELSSDYSTREYFKNSNSLKSIIKSGHEPFPNELEERIFESINNNTNKRVWGFANRNIYSFVSYALAIIFIVVSVVFYLDMRSYERELKISSEQIRTQDKLINMLYNSLPSAEVQTTVDYKVIITEKL